MSHKQLYSYAGDRLPTRILGVPEYGSRFYHCPSYSESHHRLHSRPRWWWTCNRPLNFEKQAYEEQCSLKIRYHLSSCHNEASITFINNRITLPISFCTHGSYMGYHRALRASYYPILMVSCQKGPTRHAYAWQIGPFWQDTLDMSELLHVPDENCSPLDWWHIALA